MLKGKLVKIYKAGQEIGSIKSKSERYFASRIWERVLNSRTMVMEFTVAIVVSSKVPPIDPLSMLFASHIEVLIRSTIRIRTPRMRNIAKVPRHAPMTGSHPATPFANTKPRATLIPMITAAR
jgi:hypothetical protein